MKVLFLTIGGQDVASSRARVYGYLPFFGGRGVRYKVISFTSGAKQERILHMKKDTFLQRVTELFYKLAVVSRLLLLSKRYDIVFVQKVILPKVVWSLLKTLNRRIVFDFDDAIYLHKNIDYLLKGALAVLVSNKNLRQFVSERNKKVYELVSPVSLSPQRTTKKKTAVTLGWTGSPETSRYLSLLMPVFKGLEERFTDLNIEFIGSLKDKDFDPLGIMVRDWSLQGEKAHFERADIGIMPLENDEWSRSKAGYKLLLYMSREIPCVASPVGINTDIIKNGVNGYLAGNTKEWFDKLCLLIKDLGLRQRMGRAARETVRERYSYDIHAPRMLHILETLIG